KQAIVKKGAKWGIIDYGNKFLLQPEYDNIAAVGDGKFYVMTQSGKSYFFDSSFKKVTEESFDTIIATDTVYAIRVKKDGKYSYYNPEAKSYVTSEKYEDAKAYENGYALVKNAGMTGVLDINGKLIIPCQYDNVVYDKLQSKIVFRILKNGKEGLTDGIGAILIPCEYDQLVPALPNYIKAKKEGKYGILRTTGVAVTEFIYDYIGSTSDIPEAPEWPAMASRKGKFGLINEKGEEVYPFKGKDMSYIGNRLYVVKEGKSLLLLTTLGKTTELNYEEVNYFGDGLAAVKKGDKWGYMTTSGEEKIKLQYEQAELFYGKLAAVKVKGKWGVIDRSGKLVVPVDNESYKEDQKGNRIFSKGEKAYVLQADGTLK
ncbi:MAG TPA: WG repeat-containing protein, partial [Cytophagaceae bacterium]|nr:WG repeat-containing protein [Cytophagaceae bacterium]